MIQTWRLDSKTQTFVLAAENHALPSVIYWGASLPKNENLEQLYHAHQQDVTGGMLDENPALSICPEARRSFAGQAGLVLYSGQGLPLFPKFSYSNETYHNQTLNLHYRDDALGIEYQADFEIYDDSDMIVTMAKLTADASIYVHWLSVPVVSASASIDEMIDFGGRWCGEFQEIRTPFQTGIHMRENRTGRTGHEHFPALILPIKGANNINGEAYGFHYGWSGGHRMIAEQLPDGRRQVQFGNAPHTEQNHMQVFQTAPCYLTYSQQGINGCARHFQNHLRNYIVNFPQQKDRQKDKQQSRPVFYNCWEAIYHQHDVETLKQIASMAAKLGAERFVLDDGWFGKRDDDRQALGDWQIDRRKYPDGLTPLIEHVHQENMSFGIWLEPEMVNPESELYRTHPDWVLGDETQILGRQQKVLNLALPEVSAFLFESISKILSNNAIDYIKWDHNRVLPMPDADQTRGIYALLDRLREAFVHVEIESCASGGGRIDFGILQRTQRVWLSDSNDAMERARIQHGAALFLPSCVTGSHVGPRHCHTSGRTHHIHFRAWIAAQRHMGFEMDPRELTDEEATILTNVTKWWKAERDWLMNADILRLDSDDSAVLAEQHLSDDEQQFVVFANKIDTSAQIAPFPLKCCALQADAFYDIDLVNRDELHHLSRGNIRIKTEGLRLSGQYLMRYGINLAWSFPSQVWVIKGKKIA